MKTAMIGLTAYVPTMAEMWPSSQLKATKAGEGADDQQIDEGPRRRLNLSIKSAIADGAAAIY